MTTVAKAAGRVPTVEIAAGSRPGRAPLSPGQRRAWFLQTRDLDDASLNVAVSYRLTGSLDARRLRSALAAVVDRHRILCTTYGLGVDGEPYQVVDTTQTPSWAEHDLSELPARSRERRVAVLLRRAVGAPFDLTGAAPLRVTLIRTGTSEFVFSVVAHTIAWDEESASIFATALSAAYLGVPVPPRTGITSAGFGDVRADAPAPTTPDDAHAPDRSGVTGRSARLDTEVIGVRAGSGFVASGPGDRAAVGIPRAAALGRDGTAIESALDYWRRALDPLPDALELPGRPVFDQAEAGRGRRATAELSAELLTGVAEFAAAHDASPFAVLFAAWQAVVWRYSGAPEFLVAVPVTTRAAGAEELIGYYGNVVLLRGICSGTDSFADLVAATEATCADAFVHGGVGIDEVVRAANPSRTGGRDGLEVLTQLGFAVRAESAPLRLDGVEATRLDDEGDRARLPLRLTVAVGATGARLEAEYTTGRPEPALVDRLLRHYRHLLTQALAAPATCLGDLELFDADERHRLIDLSRGELVPTPPTTLVRLFEDQVRTRPDAPALLAPGRDRRTDRTLTYRELDVRANRLAHWLIGHGIGTEDIVGLRSSTSVEFIVAVLAVLKAGGAYLPIDPAYPDERIAFLDADAGARLVLGPVELAAAEESARTLPEHPPVDAERARPLRPGNLAYLVYTSGSTGKPKGVPVPHAAIAEHLIGFCAQWDLTAEDRVLQSSSVSFDASLLDIFVTLTVGACLVVPKPDAFRDIAHVAELISRCAITVLHMVPSTLSTFLLLPEVSEWGALRHVPVGGEALTGEVADRFAGVFDAELRNHYGPTEAVVCATHMPVVGPQGPGTVPIGVPNRNVYAYVLDERLGLVPDGVVGEIYLGGAQLARGYHERPMLTAQRFVADPFLPGSRLYRTGDLARRNDAGALEFVGRADDQVKVRGFRIEPAEVQAALASHPAVGQCVVLASTDPALGTVLAAYLVPVAGRPLDLTGLRAHVAAALPEYMVPAEFVVLDALPLTEHGKLDRNALPSIRAGAGEYRAPATATEIRLAALFAQLFSRTEIGAQDSFFELGGHSLLAAGLVARIRAEFGVDIDVRVPFDTPTVAGLAALIESRPPARIPLPPLTRHPRVDPAPLSRAQRASWDRLRAGNFGAGSADTAARGVGNVSLTVRLDGRLDLEMLRSAVAEAAGRHEILRTVFAEVDGEPVPSRSAEPVTVTVQPTPGPTQLAAATAAAVRQPFDPRVAPPLDVRILVEGKRSHVIVLTAHELIADHRSLHVLLAETAVAYRARLADAEPLWPPPEFDFADIARWEHEAADALAAQRDYWRTALAGAPVASGPAADLPGAPVASGPAVEPSGARVASGPVADLSGAPVAVRQESGSPGVTGHIARFPVPAQLRNQLRILAESAGASEFMLYQAAVLALLHKLGAGTDIVVGAAVGGRGDAMAAGVVGPLTGVVALRTDLRGNPSLRTVLDRARATALAGYGHQDVARDAVDGAGTYATILHFDERDRSAAPHFGAGLTATVLPPEFDGALRDVGFGFTAVRDGGFAATVTLNADRYHRDTAHLFARRMLRVLGAFAETPDLALADLDVMPAEERRRVLGEWSCGVEVLGVPGIAELLARSLTYPSVRPALRCGADVVDYGTVCDRLLAAARDQRPGRPEDSPLGVLLAALEQVVVAEATNTRFTLSDELSFEPAALAAAVADRRGVAACRDVARPDPARSTAQCRVIGADAGPVGLLVETFAALADGALVELAPEGVAAVVTERTTHVVAGVAALPTDAAEAGTRRWDVVIGKGLRATAPRGVLGMAGYVVPGYAGPVARGPLDGTGRVRPVPGARVLVLDAAGNPVPPGVCGQVWIGGIAQAGPEGGELLATGDRAHWTTDGWLKFA
ncbi:amino acid adenylation domain-containing protein [Nocardia sp. NPDC059177]|uniref:amino acid adenylation domain-containing protein n=1 Tax=Nocardia sp. NPDC059177 TaxID=3346759 RepID=UPI003692D5C4